MAGVELELAAPDEAGNVVAIWIPQLDVCVVATALEQADRQ